MRFLNTGLGALMFIAFHLSVFAQENWQKIDFTKDSISIYENINSKGNIYEYKAVCIVNASAKVVYNSAIADETYRELKHYVKENKVYKTNDINSWYVYQRFSGMILSDRDYTLRYDCHSDPLLQKYSVNWKISNDIGPVITKNVVRIKTCNGSIVIWPHKNNQKSYLQYQICTDPGGSIPTWIINVMNKSTIPDVLRAIVSHSKG
jgi:hypothetical protein